MIILKEDKEEIKDKVQNLLKSLIHKTIIRQQYLPIFIFASASISNYFELSMKDYISKSRRIHYIHNLKFVLQSQIIL